MEETDILGATDATSLFSTLFALMNPIDTNRLVELVAGHSQKTPSLESLIELSVSFLKILRKSEISGT